MTRRPGTAGLLELRSFRLLLASQAASVFGDAMARVALPFAVLEIGGSIAEVGLVGAAQAAPFVATLLAGGVVADRTSRRAVMIAGDLARLLSQGLLAALLLSGSAEIWMLAALAAVSGIASGFFVPAATGVLPEVVAADDLQRANALRSSAISVGEIAGPVAAGILVAFAGAGSAIAVDAATFALSAAFLTGLELRRFAPTTHASFLSELREGWTAFRGRRWVWSSVAGFALVNVMWAAWPVLGPVVAERSLGGAGAWGAVLGTMGAGALVGSLAATRIDPQRPIVVAAVAHAVYVTPLAFLAAGAGVAVLAGAAFVSGFALVVSNSVWDSTLQRRIPPQTLSRVTSYDWFATFAPAPIAMAAWGPLATVVGLQTALWVAFACATGFGGLVLASSESRNLSRGSGPASSAHRPGVADAGGR